MIFILILLFLVNPSCVRADELSELKEQIKIIQDHEGRLAQECLNLRYQIDVLSQMVKQ